MSIASWYNICTFMQEEFLREEEKKMRRLRYIVDLTEAVLVQSNLTLRE